jgi:hypothetical protein
MLIIKSDLNLLDRMSVEYTTDLLASGVQGTWVTINSSNKAEISTTSGASGLSFAVFNESNADGTQGYSPDTSASGKVTLLNGPYRAVTSEVAPAAYAALSIGDPVMAGDDGKLVVVPDTVAGAKAVVGYVKQKITTLTHRGTTYTNVIEYVAK